MKDPRNLSNSGLAHAAEEMWSLALRSDRIPDDAPCVVFTPDNPFVRAYDDIIREAQRRGIRVSIRSVKKGQ